jgi:DNA-directed RNA polymerase specialized sigma24 family protein
MSETATALAWAEKRVENLLYRGLKELRLCLGEKGLSDA